MTISGAKINSYWNAMMGFIRCGRVIAALLALEVLSYSVFHLPALQLVTFTILAAVAAVFSFYRLRWGVLIVFAELVVGSKGYLFFVDLGGFRLSLRLTLFLILFAATAWEILRTREIAFFKWQWWKQYTALVAAIGLAVVTSLLHGNGLGNLFFDLNGYLYVGLIIPMTQALRSREDVLQLLSVVYAAAIVVIIKTLLVLGLFSQLELLPFTLPGVYKWVRDTGIGEITRFPNGFSRIFFQGHIYAVVLYFTVMAWLHAGIHWGAKNTRRTVVMLWLFATALLAVIFLSYSRSFWLATAVTLIAMPIVQLVYLRQSFRETVGRTWRVALATALSAGAAFLLIVGIVNLPLPGNSGVNASSIVSDRTSNISDEPAASSRWQLLPVLWDASLKHPVLGSGFGATVTYTSDDPRVREENPDGQYTTFSFEWGYLDFLYKFGVVGLLPGLWFVYTLVAHLWSSRPKGKKLQIRHITMYGMTLSLIVLAGVHMFTPYLNHPLGIGWVLLVSMVLTLPKSSVTTH